MSRTILITGAAGSVGRKLKARFLAEGWQVRGLDIANENDGEVEIADLAVWDDDWVARFAGVDTVVHLAGAPWPDSSWSLIQRLNLDLCLNVFEAAVKGGVRRLIFASSNWTMAGHRFADGPLATDMEPAPVNPYGASKLFGERIGRSFSERHGLSVICFRIGYCQHTPGNLPGTHMNWNRWGQAMWLSDRDIGEAHVKAVLAPDDLRFAVLNLMSANEGMRWDIETTRKAIGYEPAHSHTPFADETMRENERQAAALQARIDADRALYHQRRW